MGFDVERVTAECVKWIQDWFAAVNPTGNAVVGISGGKDSSVVAALCAKALGKERVVGVLMPNGEQKDISDSRKIVEHLGIKYVEVNIADAYDGILNGIQNGVFGNTSDDWNGITCSEQTLINVAPRIRMTTLYAVGQSVNGMVANTCNLSEDHVGYSTLFGDYSGSFSPLGKLTVTEVRAIGKYLELPIDLVDKAPSDGLCGKTDEDNLGFTYAELDVYLRTGVIENLEHKEKIDRMYKRNKFKLELIHIPTYDPKIEIKIEH
ncbi:MAG: NAD(+) synthase [Eubacteriales bacterium]|nr:NAD(+) synthase [Eubacteriales bacterium]